MLDCYWTHGAVSIIIIVKEQSFVDDTIDSISGSANNAPNYNVAAQIEFVNVLFHDIANVQ